MTNQQKFPNPTTKPGISAAIIILAAGRPSRMSPDAVHKLLAKFDGVSLVRRVALQAIENKATAFMG